MKKQMQTSKTVFQQGIEWLKSSSSSRILSTCNGSVFIEFICSWFEWFFNRDRNEKNPSSTMDIKKISLETIKRLYFKCGGDENYEHLYILPWKWIDLL